MLSAALKPATNLALTRLVRPDEEIDQPAEQTVVAASYAHFEVTLERLIKDEITTDVYDASLATACAPFGFDTSSDAQKIPTVMHDLLTDAKNQGRTCASLEALVRAIWLHLKNTELQIPAAQGVAA
jgi:hypothetical protein